MVDCGTTGHTLRSPEAATKKSYSIVDSFSVESKMMARLVLPSTSLALPWMKRTPFNAGMSLNLVQAFGAKDFEASAKGAEIK